MGDFGAAASAVGGVLSTVINNEYANYRTERDRQQNYSYNERAAENADRRTRALYNDFYSPEALKRQYEEAGLSPSLMFGGTPGQGGMAGAQSAGPNGPQTPFMPFSMVETAQAAALMAQAKKTNAETETITGENERGAAEIAGILIENNLKSASTDFIASQKTAQDLANYYTQETMDWKISEAKDIAERAEYEANQAYWAAQREELDFDFQQESYVKRMEIIGEEVKNLAADTALKEAQKDLTDKQKWALEQTVAQEWQRLKLKKEELTLQAADNIFKWRQWQKEIEIAEKNIDAVLQGIEQGKRNNIVSTIGHIIGAGITGGCIYGLNAAKAAGKFAKGAGKVIGKAAGGVKGVTPILAPVVPGMFTPPTPYLYGSQGRIN